MNHFLQNDTIFSSTSYFLINIPRIKYIAQLNGFIYGYIGTHPNPVNVMLIMDNPIFNIKRYKAPKAYLRHEISEDNKGKFPFSDMLEYQCVIVVFEREKIITIRYVVSAHKWIMVT